MPAFLGRIILVGILNLLYLLYLFVDLSKELIKTLLQTETILASPISKFDITMASKYTCRWGILATGGIATSNPTLLNI
jgi:hypothetical protein